MSLLHQFILQQFESNHGGVQVRARCCLVAEEVPGSRQRRGAGPCRSPGAPCQPSSRRDHRPEGAFLEMPAIEALPTTWARCFPRCAAGRQGAFGDLGLTGKDLGAHGHVDTARELGAREQ